MCYRYVAICYPFISHTMSKLSRAVKFIMAIWVLAFCLAIPQAMQFGIVDDGSKSEEKTRCSIKRKLLEHAFEISTMLLFVVPMTVITILYILIGVKLRRSRLLSSVKRTPIAGGLNHYDSTRGKNSSQRNVIRMLGEYKEKNIPALYLNITTKQGKESFPFAEMISYFFPGCFQSFVKIMEWDKLNKKESARERK